MEGGGGGKGGRSGGKEGITKVHNDLWRRDMRYGVRHTHGFPSTEHGVKESIVLESKDKLWQPGDLEHEQVLQGSCGTHIAMIT